MVGFLRRKWTLTKNWRRDNKDLSPISIFAISDKATTGHLKYGNLQFPVALGRGGIRALKKEGDGATPMGRLSVLYAYYRQDRLPQPRSRLALQPIRPGDGWCDATGDRNYNRKVPMPYPASAERMWRKDHLYDIVVVLDYNIAPRAQGRGSAIFMHVARRNFAPTAGCIAMKREHLLRLLAAMPDRAVILTGKSQRPRYRGRRGLR